MHYGFACVMCPQADIWLNLSRHEFQPSDYFSLNQQFFHYFTNAEFILMFYEQHGFFKKHSKAIFLSHYLEEQLNRILWTRIFLCGELQGIEIPACWLSRWIKASGQHSRQLIREDYWITAGNRGRVIMATIP